MKGRGEKVRRTPTSFLLSQLGSHAAAKFAEALTPLGFEPYHAGIFRLLVQSPGISQQDLARNLNMHASRLVLILDELEERKLLERRPAENDRRLYALHLTRNGEAALQEIGQVAQEHHRAMMKGLNPEQQETLTELLEALAQSQGLAPGIHPGYRRL